jgi:hypothetical protein
MGNLRFSEINGKILSSMKRLENQTIFDFAVKDFLTKGILARKTTPSEAEWEAQGKSAVWLKGQPGTSQAMPIDGEDVSKGSIRGLRPPSFQG